MIHDDWSDLAAERLDKIEQLQDDLAEVTRIGRDLEAIAIAKDTLAAERLDRIEELTERLSILVDERDQANAAVARLLTRAEIAEKRLAMVRGNMLTATETIAKMQAELDRFEPVTVVEVDYYRNTIKVDSHDGMLDAVLSLPVAVYRKAGEQ